MSVVPGSEIPVPETSYRTEEQCPLSERPQLRSTQVCELPVTSIVAPVMSHETGREPDVLTSMDASSERIVPFRLRSSMMKRVFARRPVSRWPVEESVVVHELQLPPTSRL